MDRPSPEEIGLRKQVRTGRQGRVEQARSAPVPDQAAPATNAPAQQGAKEDRP